MFEIHRCGNLTWEVSCIQWLSISLNLYAHSHLDACSHLCWVCPPPFDPSHLSKPMKRNMWPSSLGLGSPLWSPIAAGIFARHHSFKLPYLPIEIHTGMWWFLYPPCCVELTMTNSSRVHKQEGSPSLRYDFSWWYSGFHIPALQDHPPAIPSFL